MAKVLLRVITAQSKKRTSSLPSRYWQTPLAAGKKAKMNVREFTNSRDGRVFRGCDTDLISRTFRLFLEKKTGFARFAVKTSRWDPSVKITILITFLIWWALLWPYYTAWISSLPVSCLLRSNLGFLRRLFLSIIMILMRLLSLNTVRVFMSSMVSRIRFVVAPFASCATSIVICMNIPIISVWPMCYIALRMLSSSCQVLTNYCRRNRMATILPTGGLTRARYSRCGRL